MFSMEKGLKKPDTKSAHVVEKLMKYDPEKLLATEIEHWIVVRAMDINWAGTYVPYTNVAIPYL